MSQATILALASSGFVLYGFRAVRSTARGAPTVWLRSQTILTVTQVSWADVYRGYISHDEIIPDGHITAVAFAALARGQRMTVAQDASLAVADAPNPNHAMEIASATTTPYHCGISQPASDRDYATLAVFPLPAGGALAIDPVDKVLLAFSTEVYVTGTVVERAFAPGVLIDLRAGERPTVQYSMDTGWSWHGEYVKTVDAGSNLVALLVEPLPV